MTVLFESKCKFWRVALTEPIKIRQPSKAAPVSGDENENGAETGDENGAGTD
jgi:hypothetical protein